MRKRGKNRGFLVDDDAFFGHAIIMKFLHLDLQIDDIADFARVGSAVVACVSTHAAGQFSEPNLVPEVEPNDTAEQATVVAPGTVFDLTVPFNPDLPGGTFFGLVNTRVQGSITPGDVDYFALDLIDATTGLTFMDAFIDPGFDGTVQIASFDGATGEVISFESFTDDSGFVPLQIPGVISSEPRTVVFAITAGNDLDPSAAGSNGTEPEPLAGEMLAFDGLAFDTGEAHDASFDYTLGFTPGFIPTPGTLAVLGLGGLAAARRRRGQ